MRRPSPRVLLVDDDSRILAGLRQTVSPDVLDQTLHEAVIHWTAVRRTAPQFRRAATELAEEASDDPNTAVIGAFAAEKGHGMVARSISGSVQADVPASPATAPTDLALMCDALPHIVWGASAQGKVDYLNLRAIEYAGLDPAALPAGPGAWLTLLHPDDRVRARRQWRDALLSGAEEELDLRMRRVDGVFRWFRCHAVPVHDDDGRPDRWFGTCTDIHGQKTDARPDRARRKAGAAADASAVAAVDHMVDGLCTTDGDGRVTSLNEAAAGMLGWAEQELLGRSLHEVVHLPPDRAGHATGECPLARVRSGGVRIGAGDDRYTHRDGTAIDVAYSAAPLPAGSQTGVVVVFRDVTEMKDRQRRELENSHHLKLEALGRLSAGLAHEINTPVQFVGDNARFLAEAYQTMLELLLVYRECMGPQSVHLPWEERQSRAERAEVEADIAYLAQEVPAAIRQSIEGIDRVATLVRAIKSFSYKDTKDHSYADLNEGIRTTVTVASSEVKYVADVVLELGELPAVLCNLGDLNQVFLNLLVNAADAMPEGGERGRITVSTRVEAPTVVITFADNGAGIPEEIRETIFDPFFTTKEVGKGTGQGLALALAVCQKHGGSIEVNSEVGRGTEFVITLPIAGKRGVPA